MPEDSVRLPRLCNDHQKAVASAPNEESRDAGTLAAVSLAPVPAPSFRNGPKVFNESENNNVFSKTQKRWQFLEPVLVSKEDRWLTPRGAPPRRTCQVTCEALVLASGSRRASEEVKDEVAIHRVAHEAPPIPIDRRPPLPRVSRRRRHQLQELKALPASRGKQLSELKPPGDFEAIEARYIRDTSGKQGAFYRSGLDRTIKEHDCEIAAMAYNRQAATMHYKTLCRDQAATWRESCDRQKGIYETRWLLEHNTEIGKRPPGIPDDRNVAPDAEQEILIAPCSSPADSPVASSLKHKVAGWRAKGRRKRKDIPVEESEASESEEEAAAVSHQRISCLKNTSLKPKQPLRTRMLRINNNAKEWRRDRAQQIPLASTQSRRLSRRLSEANDTKGHLTMMKQPTVDLEEEMRSVLSDFPQLVKSATRKTFDLEHSSVAHRSSEEDVLRQVFDLYDVNQSGSLDQSELASCLAEVGLRGKNHIERSEIRELLWSINELEVSFEDFKNIIPAVRDCLARLQSEKLKEYFLKADEDHSGMLSVDETLAVLRLMGTFPNDEQVKDAIVRVVPEASETARTIEGGWLLSKDILNLDAFGKFVRELQERTERSRSERARHLVMEYHLSDKEKDTWFQNLVDIHQTFSRYGSQFISTSNAEIVIRECGLSSRHLSKSSVVQEVINELSDDDDTIDFPTLLRIGDRLREHDRQWLLRVFDKYDANKTGGLSISEVHGALVECGIRPRTHHESSEISALIDEFDVDSSGEVDHEEFVSLVRFVCEKLHRVQREEERQRAVRYGWDESRFDELRSAFVSFDEDGNDTLTSHEVMQAIDALQRSYLREDINPVLREHGLTEQCKQTKMNFLDFMKLMKALDLNDNQRRVAGKHGFMDNESVCRLRAAFKALSPNEEGLVLRDSVRHLLSEGEGEGNPDLDHFDYLKDLQRELSLAYPVRVSFDVFAKFMRKKLDLTGQEEE